MRIWNPAYTLDRVLPHVPRMESTLVEEDWPASVRARFRSWWTEDPKRTTDSLSPTRLGLFPKYDAIPPVMARITVFRAIFTISFHLSLEAQIRAGMVISTVSRVHQSFAKLIISELVLFKHTAPLMKRAYPDFFPRTKRNLTKRNSQLDHVLKILRT